MGGFARHATRRAGSCLRLICCLSNVKSAALPSAAVAPATARSLDRPNTAARSRVARALVGHGNRLRRSVERRSPERPWWARTHESAWLGKRDCGVDRKRAVRPNAAQEVCRRRHGSRSGRVARGGVLRLSLRGPHARQWRSRRGPGSRASPRAQGFPRPAQGSPRRCSAASAIAPEASALRPGPPPPGPPGDPGHLAQFTRTHTHGRQVNLQKWSSN